MAVRSVRVGDKVRFPYGTTELTARVVRDLGPIGVDGRQLVFVSVRSDEDEGGDVREFCLPAEALTVIEPTAA